MDEEPRGFGAHLGEWAAMNPGHLLAMRVLGALAAIALTAYLALIAWAVFPSQATADFYQFWGVGAVREAESIRAVTPRCCACRRRRRARSSGPRTR